MPKTIKDSRIKLQTNVDNTLHPRFKIACFLQGKSMNDVMTELISYCLETDEEQFPTEDIREIKDCVH